MRVELATVGARGVDSYPYSIGGTAEQARALACSGIDFFVGYLGSMNAARLGYVLDAGLAFMPVTKAGEYEDGAGDEVAQLRALGIPAWASVWLDLEGMNAWNQGKTAAGRAALAAKINAWATKIAAGGWMPCLYVGSPQPFTSVELYALGVVRYWLGIGRAVDHTGDDAYPKCGWCMRQDWHGNPEPGRPGGMYWKNTGVFVDTNSIQRDHFGRLPTWVKRAT